MHIAEPRASNSSLKTLYACKSWLYRAVLHGATCLATREEDSTATEEALLQVGAMRRLSYLHSSIASNQFLLKV